MRQHVFILLVSLLFLSLQVTAYENCTELTIGNDSQESCAFITYTESCIVNVQLEVNNQTIFQGGINIENSRSMCSTFRSCQLCFEIEDYEVYNNTANMCYSVNSRDCLLPFPDTNWFSDCFEVENSSSVSNCIHCPDDCGGLDRGYCDAGHCICNEGWTGPTCLTPVAPINNHTNPGVSDNVQCLNLPEPANISFCLEVILGACNITVNTTLNGDPLIDISLDLIKSDDVQSQCQKITNVGPIECDACLNVNNKTTVYSDDLDIYVFEFCLEFALSHGCAVIALSDDFNPLPLGCFQIPASECHGDCSGCLHGFCDDGVCICEEPWYGLKCDKKSCLHDCNGNGECVEGICLCDEDYFGEDCSLTCEQEIEGNLLQGKKRYNNELTPDSITEAWNGFIDITETCGSLDFDIFVPSNTSLLFSDIEFEIYIQHNCPPTKNQYDLFFTSNFKQNNQTLHVHDTFRIFDSCDKQLGTWFFSIYCIHESACPFDIRIWPSLIEKAKIDKKYLGELTFPHSDFYNFTLPSYAEWSILLKIKDNGNLSNYEDYIISYVDENNCPASYPNVNSDSIVISQAFARDSSSLYAYQYNISHTSYANGSSWIMNIQSLIPYSIMEDSDSIISYSLQIYQEFLCIPGCLNNGTCSTLFPNTCDCTEAGYKGDRCESPLCDPRCGPHGQCVSPNHCVCDYGWEGEICIDIAHDTASIPLQLLSSISFSTIIVIVVIILFILFAFFLLVVKIKRDKYFIKDLKELGFYILHCCKRPDAFEMIDE